LKECHGTVWAQNCALRNFIGKYAFKCLHARAQSTVQQSKCCTLGHWSYLQTALLQLTPVAWRRRLEFWVLSLGALLYDFREIDTGIIARVSGYSKRTSWFQGILGY
jgi:hypothetical protein